MKYILYLVLLFSLDTHASSGETDLGFPDQIPSQTGNSGKFLSTDGSMLLWQAGTPGSGTVTSVVSGIGLVPGTITNSGTINVDVGTGANQVVQLNGSAQYPAIDGYLITNVNAQLLQSNLISAVAPTSGQVLGWNVTTTQWQPITPTAYVSSVSGTPPIVSSGGLTPAISIPVSTTSVDGYLSHTDWNTFNGKQSAGSYITALTGDVTASGPGSSAASVVKIRGTSVSAVAPTSGQILTYNNTSSQWDAEGPQYVGTVTNVTASAPILSSGGATPNLSIPVATSSVNGYLSSTDWSTFNNKVSTTRAINTTAPITGGGDLSADRTIAIPVSTNSVDGYLSAADHTTFNAKQAAGNYITALTGDVTASGPGSASSTVVKIQSVGIATTSPTNNQLLTFNGTTSNWEPRTPATNGTVTSVVSGAGLVAGTITSAGTITVDLGTAANKVLQVTSGGQYPAIDGFLITNLNAVPFSRTISTTAPITGGGDLSANRTIAIPAATTSVDGYLTSVDWNTFNGKQASGSYITSLTGDVTASGPGAAAASVVKIQGFSVATNAPTSGQFLGWNVTTTKWQPLTPTAYVSSVTGTPPIASSGGLTPAISISQSTTSVDGYLSHTDWNTFNGKQASGNYITALTGDVTASGPGSSAATVAKIQGVSVSTTAPTDAQVLTYNNSSSKWEARSPATSGTVTSVVSGTGLVAGTITSVGTINVDVGTLASKIVQLTAGAQYPAVDGFLITNLNAVPFARTISTTSPLTGGGDLSANRTIAIPVATSSVNGYLSSTDWSTFNGKQASGSYITALTGDVTASGPGSAAATVAKIQGVSISTVAPTDAQVLTYNNGSSKWEARAPATSGTVTSVISGAGLVAGTITTVGTLNVDIGTTASKIVQLTAAAKYPAVDGSLITNIPAITALTGDATASGPGSAALTLATVNSNVGSFGSSTSIPSITVNGKGLVTAASGNAVIAPAGTLTGTALASNVVTSSLTSVGTISSGTWNGTTIAIANGGTGATSLTGANIMVKGGNAFGSNITIGATDNFTYSVLTNNISRLTIDSFGNVGIGTTAPGSLLDVSNAVLADGTQPTTLRISGLLNSNAWTAGAPIANLDFYNNDPSGNGANTRARISTMVDSTDDGTGRWWAMGLFTTTSGNSAPTEKLHIAASGNVGIGTVTPQAQLHTTGTVRLSNFGAGAASFDAGGNLASGTLSTANGGTGSTTLTGANIYIKSGNSFGSNATLGTGDNYTLGFLTNNTTRMTIDAAGSIGIGTPTPQNMVDIERSSTSRTTPGSSGFPQLKIENLNASQGDGASTYNYAEVLMSAGNGVVSGGLKASYNSGGTVPQGIYFGSQSSDKLFVQTNSITALTVDTSQNVGIGTLTPTSSLMVQATEADTSGTDYLSQFYLNASPTSNSTGTFYDVYSFLDTTGATTHNIANTYAGYFLSNIGGTGIVTTARGTYNYVHNVSTGTVTNAYGSYNLVNNNGGGVTTTAYGVYGLVESGGGSTITTAYSLYADNAENGSGTITTAYGVYIATLQGITTYGLYQAGTGDTNYLAGNTGVGTNAPQSTLDVSMVGGTTAANGGTLTLSRADASATANDTIGKIQFWNNDTQLTTQNFYGSIEVQAAQTVTTDAAAGNMIFKTTSKTTGTAPTEHLRLDFAGHVITTGTAPAVSACGTTPTIAGTDVNGRVTVGTGGVAASCTITFATAYANAPVCIADDESSALLLKSVATTTTLTISVTTTFGASDKLTYICLGY